MLAGTHRFNWWGWSRTHALSRLLATSPLDVLPQGLVEPSMISVLSGQGVVFASDVVHAGAANVTGIDILRLFGYIINKCDPGLFCEFTPAHFESQ